MKFAHIRIQNVLGARAVDIAITRPVVVVAGRNYAGKSSLNEAVRLALSGETVRVDLKKDYGHLVSEGADAGLVEVGLHDGPFLWCSLPDGKRTPQTEYVPPAALPYVLDAQRFARLPENERRSFLFGLMGLKADGAAVRQRLAAMGCDAVKIEAAMPLLRAGFAAACEEVKSRARDAKAAWRAVTGETYGDKKAASWKAAQPEPLGMDLDAAKRQLNDLNAQIDDVTTRLGELRGRAEQASAQAAKLADLREKAAGYARINDKLILDTKERDDWKGKVDALLNSQASQNATPCPDCGSMLLIQNGVLVHAAAPAKGTEDELMRLPEYRRALELMERSVANGQRDLAAADAAANALRELEAASGEPAPTAEDIAALAARKSTLAHEKTNQEMGLRMAEDIARAMATAAARTAEAAKHHADVDGWAKIGDALAPGGIPAAMLAEALAPINARLAQSAADTGWRGLRISDGMEILADHDLDGVLPSRPYALLSESEQWRADAMIAEAVSHLSGLKLLLLDRFDVLDLQGRDDLLAWLDILACNNEIETALVSGTLKALPSHLPGTIEMHWMENGVVGQIKAAA